MNNKRKMKKKKNRMCGPHNVEEKGERERERYLGEFTLQANIDLGHDLASLM
jgi:uncharacterized protein YutE (UPF0331/DUF86 family)